MKKSGNYIKSLRQAKDMTLSEVGAKAGISLGYVHQVERGYEPSFRVKRRLADALEVPIHYLFNISEQERSTLKLIGEATVPKKKDQKYWNSVIDTLKNFCSPDSQAAKGA